MVVIGLLKTNKVRVCSQKVEEIDESIIHIMALIEIFVVKDLTKIIVLKVKICWEDLDFSLDAHDAITKVCINLGM